MIYYNETGELLPAEEIDLEKGYLVDRETVHHEAETHTSSKTLPGVPTYIPITNSDGSVNVSESAATLENVAYIKFLVSGNGTLTAICPENKPTYGIWLRVPGMVERR